MAISGLHPWQKAIIAYGWKEKETPCDLIGLVSQYQPMETPDTPKAKVIKYTWAVLSAF